MLLCIENTTVFSSLLFFIVLINFFIENKEVKNLYVKIELVNLVSVFINLIFFLLIPSPFVFILFEIKVIFIPLLVNYFIRCLILTSTPPFSIEG